MPLKEILEKLIQSGTTAQYLLFFKKYHEADIAETLESLSIEKRKKFFQKLNPEMAVDILEEMSMPQQTQLISTFKVEVAAKYIQEMHPDDAVDLLEELQETNEKTAKDIIKALPKEDANDLKELLAYPEDSAGAIMTNEFLSIPENLTVKSALADIKKQNPPDSEIAYHIYITDSKQKLKGYTSLRNLFLESPKEKVQNIRDENPIKAFVNDDQEVVAKLFQKYDLVTLPVVDKTNKLVGIITVDDIVDVVVEEATEDLYKLSGTSDIEEIKLISGNIPKVVLSRTPWLLLTIFGGVISSLLITTYSNLFQTKHFTLALSLSFIPLLTGLGGNVGTQSATIIVRGLATGQIKIASYIQTILRETWIGFILGFILSSVVLLFNILIAQHGILFSSIVSLAILLNITVAAILGASLPLFLHKSNIDPAIASAPFISTTLDICGQLIYFSLTLFIFKTFF